MKWHDVVQGSLEVVRHFRVVADDLEPPSTAVVLKVALDTDAEGPFVVVSRRYDRVRLNVAGDSELGIW